MLKTLTIISAFLAGAKLTEVGAREYIRQIKTKHEVEIMKMQSSYFHAGWNSHKEWNEMMSRQSSYSNSNLN